MTTQNVSLYEKLNDLTYTLANEIDSTVECDENMLNAMYEISQQELDGMDKVELISHLGLESDATDEDIQAALDEYDHYEGFTIYQTYIVNEYTHEVLQEYGQLTWYCKELDCYFWGVMHYGTPWTLVMGDIYPVNN